MTAIASLLYPILGLALLGIVALLSDKGRLILHARIHQTLRKNETNIVDDPWVSVAPRVVVKSDELPFWLSNYVKWHTDELKRRRNDNNNNASSLNGNSTSYLIYTCRQGHHCSGTGNRQRGIAASFLVAIITKRIFLMDIDNPIPLQEILWPHLLQWDDIPTNIQKQFPAIPIMDIRNIQPNPLQKPMSFVQGAPRVIRVLANGPGGLETIWSSAEMQTLLQSPSSPPSLSQEEYNATEKRTPLPKAIYKWLFTVLFQPSPELVQFVHGQRKQLGLTSMTEMYVGIHVRLGGGGAWTGPREERYNVTALPLFLHQGQMLQETLSGNANGAIQVPIIVISDDNRAKVELKNLDSSIRFTDNSTLVHVDRSKHDPSMKQGMLQVWADVLVLAQSTCLVESLSSFSSLARRISISASHDRCFVRQDQGMLLDEWKPYWNKTTTKGGS